MDIISSCKKYYFLIDSSYSISCVTGNLGELPIPAAVAIFDSSDPEIELKKFDSSQWSISGKDMSALGGIPGIAIANTTDNPSIEDQLGIRIDQVTGSDEFNNFYVGAAAILEDPNLPKNLDAYSEYFKKIAIDVSGTESIPTHLLGSPEKFQVLYANLSLGDIKIAGSDKGHGVIVLEGNGIFEMVGGSEWRGIVICAGSSNIALKGGGHTAAHIYGALLLADGNVEMNGTADVKYSSDILGKVNRQLLLYQVYSWCAGWGECL